MKNHMQRFALVVAAGIALVGCGEDTPASVSATLEIDSPNNGSTVNVPASPQAQTVPVNFTTNYTLRAQGQCGTIEHCGHINVLIDSTACDSAGVSYNVQAITSPAEADFGKCPTATGQHMITLELHNDADQIVKNLVGDSVNASVTVTAQ